VKKGGRAAFLYFLRVRGAPEFEKYKERDCCLSSEERLKSIVGYFSIRLMITCGDFDLYLKISSYL
jgi:hypothetical protein